MLNKQVRVKSAYSAPIEQLERSAELQCITDAHIFNQNIFMFVASS